MRRLGIGCFDQRETDALCVLTQGQEAWPVATMSFLLGKQSGIEMRFIYHDMPLPEAPIYLLPSVKGWTPLYKKPYYEILRRVYEAGSTLYLSWDGGAIEAFEEVFRLCSRGQYALRGSENALFHFDGQDETLPFFCPGNGILLQSAGADVLAETAEGLPVWTAATYGKGKVFFLSFGLEAMLWKMPMAFDTGSPYARIYRTIRENSPASREVLCANPLLCLSRVRKGDQKYAVVVNPSATNQPLRLTIREPALCKPPLGVEDMLSPGDFSVLEITY